MAKLLQFLVVPILLLTTIIFALKPQLGLVLAQGFGRRLSALGSTLESTQLQCHAIITEADGSYSFRELSETSASAFTSSTNVTGIVTGMNYYSRQPEMEYWSSLPCVWRVR